ncbi:MAG TPA: group I intron-associated PD-(D/E)XK endonuclease [Candidatus Sulfotelmatobacter sp.]|nr:group I intron-associated PD-(D/E)XK endonuclease [Candidatus Sulfotelmatobacter sp.]
MKNRGMKIKHAKLRGEWVELQFMARAIELGLHLAKPWGEVVPYDFFVEHKARVVRVQVKSTMFKDRGGYSCTVRGSAGPYEGNPFEYLAAYVFQESLWYIIPAELVVGQGSIALYPRMKRSKYDEYKEAWHFLRGPAHRVDRIEACVEEAGGEVLEGYGVFGGEEDSELPPDSSPSRRLESE